MADYIPRNLTYPPLASTDDMRLYAQAYKMGGRTHLDLTLNSPQIPEEASPVLIQYLWQNFMNGLADCRVELAIINCPAPQLIP